MTKLVEQCYCIKFCQKLSDTESETFCKIQQVFGNDAMSVTQIKNGIPILKIAKLQLSVTSVPVDHQRAEIQMLLRKCAVCSWKPSADHPRNF